MIDEYQSSVDEGLVDFAEDTLSGNGSNKAQLQRYQLKPVPRQAAEDIRQITNVDTTGFSTAIERRMIEHIMQRHGENGEADHSMRDLNDLGRIQYVLDHYDSVSCGGRSSAYTTVKPNGRPGQAQTVIFEKAVNGTYYVVEAVPDTKAKTTFIVSAYYG